MRVERAAPVLVLLLLLQLTAAAGPLSAQSNLAQRSRTNRVVVHHHSDTAGRIATSGWVMAVTDSTLLFDTGDRLLSMERREIESVELRIPPHREFGLLGIVTGAWLLNYAVIRHSNSLDDTPHHSRSTFLLKGDEHNVHTVLLLSSAGAIPGGLLGMVVDRLLVEEVRHYRADRDDEWSQLRERLEGIDRLWEIDLVTGVRVWNGGEGRVDERHAAAGDNRQGVPVDYGPVQWLRRGAVHGAVSEHLSLGLTWVDLSTPTRTSSLNLHIDSLAADDPDRRHLIRTTVSLNGYAASVIVRPFEDLPDPIDVRIGAGAGVAVGVFDEDIRPAWWNAADGLQRSRSTGAVIPFGMLTADVAGYVTEGLRFGISGDVGFLMPFEMPLPEGSQGTESASFSSASIGLIVGYRF